jgi:hypothetical protein
MRHQVHDLPALMTPDFTHLPRRGVQEAGYRLPTTDLLTRQRHIERVVQPGITLAPDRSL